MPSRREFVVGVAGLAGAVVSSDSVSAADAPALTWERTYAPENRERALVGDLVPLGDGFALVGFAGGLDDYRGWVGSVDPAGRSRWHRFEGTGRSAFLAGASTVGDSDGVVVAGRTNASSDRSSSDYVDPYVVRANANGDVPWARTYQPAVVDGQASAITGAADGYVVAGSRVVETFDKPWAVHVDAHGTRTWTWHGDRAGTVNDAVGVPGGVLVGGSNWPPGSEVPEPRGSREGAWVAKLTTDGSVAWQWRIDREGGDRVEALAPGPDGGVVAVGRRGFATWDRGVGWLVALDAEGNRLWERTYPQDVWNWHSDVASVGDGYVLAGTREEGPDTDERGAWLLRVDDEGRVVWDYQAETGTSGSAVLSLADGGLLVGGQRSVSSGAGSPAWLAKVGGTEPSASVAEDGPSLPALPGWTGPFVAGSALGTLAASALGYWRRSSK